ncbi:MAG TPA: VWA domain-containing protein, partial [Pyrinomonadaceae bacterium]|nr:VWA domain-containing protein [Pyrinomonadaceae bacterium]
MKRLILVFVCLGLLSLSAFTQTGRGTRPRVVPTPTPQSPSLGNDTTTTTNGRRPPALSGTAIPRSTPSTSSTPPVSEEDEVVKVETNLVTMPVSVLDRDGRFISGLQQRDFKIFENGVEQKVEYFQSVEQPFTVVLMIDVSPSTAFRIEEIHDGAIAFVEQLRPADRVMVIAFDERTRILCQPTNNRRVLREAIYQAQFGDGTSIYEAIDQVINRELVRITGRKAVVLFTDGVDTTSRRANYESTVADVEEVDALFYPIRYNTERQFGGARRRGGTWVDLILGGSGGGSAGSGSSEYARGLSYLEALAQNSGGRKFEADSLHNLESAFAGIAEELRRQYSLGYYPDKVGQTGERRRISVRVMRPN